MYNNRRAKSNKITKNVKDYIIPIIIGIFSLLIIFNIFRGSDENIVKETDKKVTINTKNAIEIKLKDSKTKAFYIDSKKKKNKLKEKDFIPNNSELIIESGIVDFGKRGTFKGTLNGRGNLKFEKNNIKLLFSDLYLESKTNSKIEMNFLTVDLNDEGIVSLSQNDTASSVYVLKGYAKITTKNGKDIMISKGKKISILKTDSHNKDIDLKTKISDIEKSFLDDTWCGIISCKSVLEKNESNNKENSESPKKTIKLKKGKKIIDIISIKDGDEIFDKKIKIEGKLYNENISDITINNISVNVNKSLGVFSLDYELKEKINDIVYKVFDNSGDVIGRGVITVYYSGDINNTKTNNSNKPQVTNYSDNPDYKIVSPGESPFTTTKIHEVIKGNVPVGKIAKIKVNNFTLTRFNSNSGYFIYHANTIHGNMKKGTNEYKIQYFGNNGEKIYEQVYFIIKK